MRTRLSTRVRLLLGGLATVPLLGGCSGRDWALPPPASDRTEYVDQLWYASWIAATVVGVFVWGLMGWAVVRYRRRSDSDIPAQVRYHLPIEVLYTVAPLIIVAVLFFHTIDTEQDLLADPEPEHVIDVVGQKWAWTFIYNDEDAVGGDTVYETGTPSDPAELWLPVDEVVKFDLNSADVIHAFWVPSFYYKEDVIPGRTNTFTLTPNVEGEYPGRCTEFCGLYHSRMLFTLYIVPRDDYDAHLQELADAGQVGAPKGGQFTREIVGDDSEGAE